MATESEPGTITAGDAAAATKEAAASHARIAYELLPDGKTRKHLIDPCSIIIKEKGWRGCAAFPAA